MLENRSCFEVKINKQNTNSIHRKEKNWRSICNTESSCKCILILGIPIFQDCCWSWHFPRQKSILFSIFSSMFLMRVKCKCDAVYVSRKQKTIQWSSISLYFRAANRNKRSECSIIFVILFWEENKRQMKSIHLTSLFLFSASQPLTLTFFSSVFVFAFSHFFFETTERNFFNGKSFQWPQQMAQSTLVRLSERLHVFVRVYFHYDRIHIEFLYLTFRFTCCMLFYLSHT